MSKQLYYRCKQYFLPFSVFEWNISLKKTSVSIKITIQVQDDLLWLIYYTHILYISMRLWSYWTNIKSLLKYMFRYLKMASLIWKQALVAKIDEKKPNISKRIMQGCSLSPILYKLYIEEALDRVIRINVEIISVCWWHSLQRTIENYKPLWFKWTRSWPTPIWKLTSRRK